MAGAGITTRRPWRARMSARSASLPLRPTAPALARADVGLAMRTGTDVAMNSAPLELVKGDLRGIATARALSVATVANN